MGSYGNKCQCKSNKVVCTFVTQMPFSEGFFPHRSTIIRAAADGRYQKYVILSRIKKCASIPYIRTLRRVKGLYPGQASLLYHMTHDSLSLFLPHLFCVSLSFCLTHSLLSQSLVLVQCLTLSYSLFLSVSLT